MKPNWYILSGLCVFASFVMFAQTPNAGAMPDGSGTFIDDNTYRNDRLNLTIELPGGAWHFFDHDKYATPESRRKDKEAEESIGANCQGPLCGKSEINVAFESPSEQPLKYAIYLTAYKLSPEYQNRTRHPLERFARVMTLGSMGDEWVPEGDLTPIWLAGRPAYRLLGHNKRTPTAKLFCYVADSNGRVFMIVALAISDSEKLQLAVENLQFTKPAN
jgi:hypothetical protein